MISKLRSSIALGVALLVTLVTLGRVDVNRSGRPAAQDGAEDPARAIASRTSR